MKRLSFSGQTENQILNPGLLIPRTPVPCISKQILNHQGGPKSVCFQ